MSLGGSRIKTRLTEWVLITDLTQPISTQKDLDLELNIEFLDLRHFHGYSSRRTSILSHSISTRRE